MHPKSGDPRHLTYCLNIHPGESWDEQVAAIQLYAARVRDQLGIVDPFGLGLRLSARSAEEILQENRQSDIKALFNELGLYAFTANIFPYGTFHKSRVKESVYAPDWRTPERLAYTLNSAQVLAGLLPEGVDGSLSTVPGSFKPWIKNDADRAALVDGVRRAAYGLAQLEKETGCCIRLGLEPEPACFLETTAETVAFFKEDLFRDAGPEEALLRRHLGVCFDACHLALQFEDLSTSFQTLMDEGIGVSKVHLSAALEADNTAEARAALGGFNEPVYLHQVIARDPSGPLHRWTDLPAALQDLPALPEDLLLRIHFHVPLFWAGDESLRSTSKALDENFLATLRRHPGTHLEIETYTFDVLPGELRSGDVVDSITREFQWMLPRL